MGHVVRMGGVRNEWNYLTQDTQVAKAFDIQNVYKRDQCKQDKQFKFNAA